MQIIPSQCYHFYITPAKGKVHVMLLKSSIHSPLLPTVVVCKIGDTTTLKHQPKVGKTKILSNAQVISFWDPRCVSCYTLNLLS